MYGWWRLRKYVARSMEMAGDGEMMSWVAGGQLIVNYTQEYSHPA